MTSKENVLLSNDTPLDFWSTGGIITNVTSGPTLFRPVQDEDYHVEIDGEMISVAKMLTELKRKIDVLWYAPGGPAYKESVKSLEERFMLKALGQTAVPPLPEKDMAAGQ